MPHGVCGPSRSRSIKISRGFEAIDFESRLKIAQISLLLFNHKYRNAKAFTPLRWMHNFCLISNDSKPIYICFDRVRLDAVRVFF